MVTRDTEARSAGRSAGRSVGRSARQGGRERRKHYVLRRQGGILGMYAGSVITTQASKKDWEG